MYINLECGGRTYDIAIGKKNRDISMT